MLGYNIFPRIKFEANTCMKKLLHGLALLTLGATFTTPASAQWPNYPTPDVPRLANGSPNLEGPMPRTEDGKPNLTRLWEIVRGADDSNNELPPGTPPL